MRHGVEFYFRDGSRKFLVFEGRTQQEIVRAAERYKRQIRATAFVLREQILPRDMDPRRNLQRLSRRVRSYASRSRLRRSSRRSRQRRPHDPRVLDFGVGDPSQFGQPHGYLGRSVLDLGDRHAHAIVDVPWRSLRVGLRKLKAKFDPWKHSLHGQRARLLAIWNPRPTDQGDRAIVEAALHVPRKAYLQLRQSGQFDILEDGVLARRGRKKKATNIFVMPP